MGALFDLVQHYENAEEEAKRTFKDFAASDINTVFFNGNEHADLHNVDGKDVLVILEDSDVRDHSAHWEAGAKQNFDTGLYNLHMTIYIRVDDYGAKPKQGKLLVLDKNKTYSIRTCDDEGGVYRMVIERVRQS
jgi:hypothetical protein